MFDVARVAALLDDGVGLWLAEVPGHAPAGCAVVQTSGSSAHPKLVVLPRTALIAAATAAQERLGLRATWHLALPGHYVAGLMVLVRGLLGGGVRYAGSQLSELSVADGPNAISLVPTQLYRALREPTSTAKLAACDAVLVGGAALSDALREQAHQAGIKLIETYGMSETCGGVVWDGVALPGVEVRLGPSGRILIGGKVLFAGYFGEPEHASGLIDGMLHTQDRGHWAADRLIIDGRFDDVIISGGINVDLAVVRAAVATITTQAEVLAVPDPEWGTRVVLVATDGDLAGWRKLLRDLLPAHCLPRQLVTVAELPRGPGGKPNRQVLLQLVQP